MGKTIGLLALSHCLLVFACGGRNRVDAENRDPDPTVMRDGAADASGAAGSAGRAGNGGGGGASGEGGRGGIAGGAGANGTGGATGTSGRGGVAGTGGDSGAADAGVDAGRADTGDASVPPDGPPTCERALYGDILDPGEVYLAGTLSEGACYRSALAHWSCPNAAVAGFDCYFEGNATGGTRPTSYVRPTDGRLIYTNSATESFIREFHCDNCPYNASKGYPQTPLANDTILPKDCELDQVYAGFFVSPTGVVLYYCPATRTWRDNGGQYTYVESNDPLLHLGYGNLALTAARIVDLGSGNAVPIVGFGGAQSAVAIRAVRPDKFWVAQALDTLGQRVDLWEIDGAGMSRRVLEYAAAPAYATRLDRLGRLDKNGAFFQIGRGQGTFEDIIVRRDMQGSSAVVYTEATNPVVKIHISGLITGP